MRYLKLDTKVSGVAVGCLLLAWSAPAWLILARETYTWAVVRHRYSVAWHDPDGQGQLAVPLGSRTIRVNTVATQVRSGSTMVLSVDDEPVSRFDMRDLRSLRVAVVHDRTTRRVVGAVVARQDSCRRGGQPGEHYRLVSVPMEGDPAEECFSYAERGRDALRGHLVRGLRGMGGYHSDMWAGWYGVAFPVLYPISTTLGGLALIVLLWTRASRDA